MSENGQGSDDFFRNLNEEKLLHKNHRESFVKQKMIFIISLFGIGSIEFTLIGQSIQILPLNDLLLFIPVVALTFDIFISAEDFKVKRIGVFLRENEITTKEEQQWEDWLTLPKHREKTALIGSIIITIVAFIVSFLMLSKSLGTPGAFQGQDLASNSKVVYWWFLICAIATGYVLEEIQFRRNELVQPIRNRISTHFVWAIICISLVLAGSLLWLVISQLAQKNILAFVDLDNIGTIVWIIMFGVTILYTINLKRTAREIMLRMNRDFSLVTFAVSREDLSNVEKRMNDNANRADDLSTGQQFSDEGKPTVYLGNKRREVSEIYLCGNFSRWQFNSIRLSRSPSSLNNAFEYDIPLESGQKLQYKYQAFDSDGIDFWFCEDSIKDKYPGKDKLGHDINIIEVRRSHWPKLTWFSKFLCDVYVKQESLRIK